MRITLEGGGSDQFTGAAAFNELQGQRDRGKTNSSHPQSPSALHCWLPAFQDAQAALPKACRQVYEIKARRTINNLAANHKNPFPRCMGVRLYDVYIHFKRASLSCTRICLMQSRVTERERTTGEVRGTEAKAGAAGTIADGASC